MLYSQTLIDQCNAPLNGLCL